MVGHIAKASCLVLLAGGLGGCVTKGSDDSLKPAEESIETYELDKATQGDLLDSETQSDKAAAPSATEKSDLPSDVDTSTLTVVPLEEPAAADHAQPATDDAKTKKKHK